VQQGGASVVSDLSGRRAGSNRHQLRPSLEEFSMADKARKETEMKPSITVRAEKAMRAIERAAVVAGEIGRKARKSAKTVAKNLKRGKRSRAGQVAATAAAAGLALAATGYAVRKARKRR
jgi:hypothetical protein